MLALLNSQQNKYDEAEKEYLEALSIYKRLAEVNYEKYGESIIELQYELAKLRNNKQ